jgi:hypothetical protein
LENCVLTVWHCLWEQFLNLFLLLNLFLKMAGQLQWVPNSKAPAMSELSSAQLTSLTEIIDRVSNTVEATTKEFENLTSWLLH